MRLKGGALQNVSRPKAYPGLKESALFEIITRGKEAFLEGKLLYCLVGFLLGRSILLGEMAPFGFPFWTVVFTLTPYKSLYVALSIIGGSLTISLGWHPLRLVLAVVSYMVIYHYLEKKKVNFPSWGIMVVSMVLSFLPQLVVNYFLLYDLIILLFEVALALLAWAVFTQVVPLFKKGNFPSQGISFEAGISLMLACIMMIIGIGQETLGPFTLQGLVTRFIILLFGYLGGGGLGAAAGAVLGFTVTLNGGEEFMPYIGVFALAGLLGGIFRELGKLGSTAGYLAGSLLLSFYLYDPSLLRNIAFEDALASIFFAAVPISYYHKLQLFKDRIVNDEGEEKMNGSPEIEKYNNLAANRIMDLAKIFDEMAVNLNKGKEGSKEVYREEELSWFTDGIISSHCGSCSNYIWCWEKNYTKTSKGMYQIYNYLAKEGKISYRELPRYLNKKCFQKKELVQTVNNLWNERSADNLYQEQLRESRKILGMQLQGLSGVIKELSREVKVESQGRGEGKITANLFTAEIGVAQMAPAEEEVSGDSFGFFDIKKEKQAVILSDGMGKGERAREESKMAVNLLEKVLKTCSRKEVAVSTVNTLLQLRFEETFSTIDLLILDLVEGTGEFVKIGACTSYIKRGEEVIEIKGSSLPLGIVPGVEPSTSRERLSGNDYIVMLTDGFTDLRGGRAGDAWFKEILKEVKYLHPQIMADCILEQAYQLFEGEVKDDFTLIVCKIAQIKQKVNQLI